MRFEDRHHAGKLLAAELARFDPSSPVVYGLPRGGMPVAYEVANAMECPLDVLVVRKLGVPSQPELAMGALAEGDVVIRNDEVIGLTRISQEEFDAVVEMERQELEARVALYRSEAPRVSPEGHTAIVVDDGLATGATARAAVEVLNELRAAAVWLAVPVAPGDGIGGLEEKADRFIALSRPSRFGAVGVWYDDFTQTSDHEVRTLLTTAR